VSRAERRSRAQVAEQVAAETPYGTLQGFGIAPVSPTSQRWFAYKCATDGTVHLLTPLYHGKLRGVGKANATGHLKMALFRFLGGVD
jgi:hypothetical protein